MDSQPPPFPDYFPSRFTSGDLRNYLNGQIIGPQGKGEAGAGGHPLAFDDAAILADGVPGAPIRQGGKYLPDLVQRSGNFDLFLDDHETQNTLW
jgi:hypothetical protein